jgi:hypothetical protein
MGGMGGDEMSHRKLVSSLDELAWLRMRQSGLRSAGGLSIACMVNGT